MQGASGGARRVQVHVQRAAGHRVVRPQLLLQVRCCVTVVLFTKRLFSWSLLVFW